jgi:hypothetical protein
LEGLALGDGEGEGEGEGVGDAVRAGLAAWVAMVSGGTITGPGPWLAK